VVAMRRTQARGAPGLSQACPIPRAKAKRVAFRRLLLYAFRMHEAQKRCPAASWGMHATC